MLCSNECMQRQLQTLSFIITLFALWIHLYALRHSSHLAWWKYSDAPSALCWDTCCSLQPELDRGLCRGIPLALVSVETCPAALVLCAFIFFPRLRWQKIAVRITLWQKITLCTVFFSVKECTVFSFKVNTAFVSLVCCSRQLMRVTTTTLQLQNQKQSIQCEVM